MINALGKPEDSNTFGDYADIFVHTVLTADQDYQRIDVVFDRYKDDTVEAGTGT